MTDQRREFRRLAMPRRDDPIISHESKQQQSLSVANNNDSSLGHRRQSVGSSTTRENSSSSAGAFDPSSPSPGRGKRPQVSQETVAARPLPKKLKYDHQQELGLHVLLPNGTSSKFSTNAAGIHSVDGLLALIKAQVTDGLQDIDTSPSRTIEWGPDVWLEDHVGNRLSNESLLTALSSAKSLGTLLLILQDGERDSTHKDKNMWNVTPKPEMLGQLPQGYTMQTALADQVDNALQAVWHNNKDCRRLVSVNLSKDKITIFDTGQGMDGSSENCIANWGTVGGSTHRAVHHKALGGEPPFLKPYLGKYGAGGVAAALHLGSCVTVWSKTKLSKKVVSLILEQKALVEKHKEDPLQRVWRTGGAFRDMTEKEMEMAPHGSFTRVEISKLKSQYCVGDKEQDFWRVDQVSQLLKDIYFPYIQSEVGSSSKTVCLVEFEVNGTNLLEITDCETAVAKMHTCNGDPFVFDIRMKKALDERDREEGRSTRNKSLVVEEANARVTCQYYPNQKGKEALETVIDELAKFRPQSPSTFETMNRITIRWLGRLLPEVKWPILPFMEVSAKKEQRSGVRRLWSKRVRAFVDTDGGFHPNQSKTELERDQPFAVALQRTGSESFAGTSAAGVVIAIRHKGKDVTPALLMDAYMDWLKEMHSSFDEDFTFLDDAIYIFNHPNAQKELGVLQNKQVIIFHKHMKDARGEFQVDSNNPLRLRLPKGANGLKSELFATVEFFFHDGAVDEHGEVKFLCRPLEVDEADGCRVVRRGENRHFQLNKSMWFPAALLGTAKRLDALTWKKRVEEVSNKSPSYVEILKEEDTKKLDLCQPFPVDNSKLEAGYTFPKEFLVVVRPKKGSGPSHKQGMIVAEPMHVELIVTRCSCRGPCSKRRASGSWGKGASSHLHEDHGQVVATLEAQSGVPKSSLKGLYMFSIGSSEVNRLTVQGTYTFHISGESEKYKDVRPAVSCIQIFPSKVTSKWTVCNHLEDCTIAQHDRVQPSEIVMRLNERLQEDIFIQKYDEYGNRQTFEKPLDLDVIVVTPNGESLEMRAKVQGNFLRATQWRHRLQIKNLLFRSGILERVERTYEGVLRVCFGAEQYADISCKVLPGEVASIQVKDSTPLIPTGSVCFQEALQPGEVIKKLTLQGLDAYGNKVDKGQKMHIRLEGLEFQDNNMKTREVDDYGCLQLGGLLKVTCHYNSAGLIAVISSTGLNLCTISFKTVIRQLVATQVPHKSYVGRQLEGICIKIVDEAGNIDSSVDGYRHSVTVDWLRGVTCPFVKGECILPDFKLPKKPGCWTGKVYFSANTSLSVIIMVQLELATACSLGPARRKTEVLSAECGVPFIVPFSVYDDQHQPAFLTESMKQRISAKAEAKDSGDESHAIFRPCTVECKDVKMGRTGDIPGYEAHIVVSGSVGTYAITLMDTGFRLKGQVESVCNLQHGHIARVVPAHLDGAHPHSLSRPLTMLEAMRCSPMPKLTVTLLDSEDNVCTSCEQRLLRMKIVDCPHWKVLVAEVSQGIGRFESSSLVVPVGCYQVSIELDASPDDLYSLDEQLGPVRANFSLRVNHGNYPSALRLLSSAPVSVLLTEEAVQYLPRMSVLVESADGMRLQHRPTVGVKLHGDDSLVLGPKEYFGTIVETLETTVPDPFVMQEDDSSPTEGVLGSAISPVRYEFAQVYVPSQAGSYVMEFFVRGTDVSPRIQHLFVKHGPPARLEIVEREPGQEMDVLQVNLVDVHGNICEDVCGLEVGLQLALSKNFTVTSGLMQCAILSRSTSIVERGKADFGVFELGQGMIGIYTLKVFAMDSDGNGYRNSSLSTAEAQIFVAHGNISDTIQQHCTRTQSLAQQYKECLNTISQGDSMIQKNRAERQSTEGNMRKLEEELRLLEGRRNAVKEVQERAHDDEIIQVEEAQPVRTQQAILHDITSWAQKGNSAALALIEAQSEPHFLSPQSTDPAAKDILGLVVMLARVESEALNRMLSEFLGAASLFLIVCRTQLGVSALEEYDARGNIDDNKGLHGFAQSRGYRLSGKYDVLTMMDARYSKQQEIVARGTLLMRLVLVLILTCRPYWRADGRHVIANHPQRILNIDPPLLPNGQVPIGFIGYAVNMLHLSSEQIQIRVATRQRGEVGLRESLFFNLLRFLQVYDTRQHMIYAKESLKNFHQGAISLDGGVIHKNQRQQLGRRSDKLTVRFSMVPPQDRRICSLLPPACHAFQRLIDFNSICREIEMKRDELTAMRQGLSTDISKLEHLERIVQKTKTEQEKITESSRLIKLQIAELMRAADAIRARNSGGTHIDNVNSQNSDAHRMRAFMI